METTASNKLSLYKAFIDVMKARKDDSAIPEKDQAQFCFMLHDEVAGTIQKVEVDDLFEWLSDGSFEKTDKLYISFLVKEF
jgi:hypothetical protein